MVQMAWTFVNDSLCTTLCLQWEPEIIAVALMYLAGKLSKFEVVDWVGRTQRHLFWWDMFVEDVTMSLLEDICHQVLDLYSFAKQETAPESPPLTRSPAFKKERILPIPTVVSPNITQLTPSPLGMLLVFRYNCRLQYLKEDTEKLFRHEYLQVRLQNPSLETSKYLVKINHTSSTRTAPARSTILIRRPLTTLQHRPHSHNHLQTRLDQDREDRPRPRSLRLTPPHTLLPPLPNLHLPIFIPDPQPVIFLNLEASFSANLYTVSFEEHLNTIYNIYKYFINI